MPDNTRTTIAIPAKRLPAFLVSEAVQKSVYTEAFGIPVPDVIAGQTPADPDATTPTGLLNGVQVWEPEWTAVLGDLDYDIAAYRKAVARE
jgi:2-aminoethylphosphonate transport system substrate-binding protein